MISLLREHGLPPAWVIAVPALIGVFKVLGRLVLFVVLFGMGNGMLTIVKGTAMAQYVSQQHVAALNLTTDGVLALARAQRPTLRP